jgi:hypothetical protein
MEFKIRNGKVLSIDTKKWLISENTTCKIVGQDDDNYEIQNENGLISKIPASIINANEIQIDNGNVSLTKGVYEYWVVAPERKRASKRFNELFFKNADKIFLNKDIVLSRAEYFLLRPSLLTCGLAYHGSFDYPLGTLIESFNSGKHFYFDEFAGFKKMYLISTSGSPLSGCHCSIFWCEKESRLIFFSTGEGPGLPKSFLETFLSFRKMVDVGNYMRIDFEDRAIELLMNEINK